MNVYDRIKRDLSTLALLYCLIRFVIFPFVIWPYCMPHDATDGKCPSGMSLHTDAETGLQYLGGQKGGLTPRLDRYGRHMHTEKVEME